MDPFADQPSILARAAVPHIIDPAWEDEIVHRATTTVEPDQQSLPCRCHELELHWSFGFLLHDYRPISDRTASSDIPNLHFDDVTAVPLRSSGL